MNKEVHVKRILLTPGEPAGIGPDIVIQAAQKPWPHELIAIADPGLLTERAKLIGLPLRLIECNLDGPAAPHEMSTLKIRTVPIDESAIPGKLNIRNAAYVINTLKEAASLCLQHKAHALVTGPVQKSIINEAGISFTGHTEFFAEMAKVQKTVMLFVVDDLKVALATIHLPLKDVPSAITKERLTAVFTVFHEGLRQQFGIASPRILVAGLNPHAGESGYLGQEEINIIAPFVASLRKQEFNVFGPLAADTLFTPTFLQHADGVLAMYHDQALPLIKHIGFDRAVNVTLGLPFIRTSVDHGTALDAAGTEKANAGSLFAAIKLACALTPPSLSD